MTEIIIKGRQVLSRSNCNAPLVSIIILNFNGMNHLKTCLDSILRTDYPNFEVIVVDNGSNDGSVEFIEEKYPEVRIIKLERNMGAPYGYMVGVWNANGKYVAILNNDIEVPPNWLTPLVKTLEKLPWVAAADPKFRSFYYRDMFEDSGAAGKWIDYFGNNCTRGTNEIDRGQYDVPAYVMGVLTFFRKEVLLKVGGFDPLFIFGYDDIDLGWRLYLAGYKIVYMPKSTIYHKSGGTVKDKMSNKLKPGFYYLNKRNKIVSIIKNYSIRNMLVALTVTVFEYSLILYYFAFKLEKEYTRDLFKAVLYVFSNLKRIMKRRVIVQALRKVSDRDIRKYMIPYCGVIRSIIKRTC